MASDEASGTTKFMGRLMKRHFLMGKDCQHTFSPDVAPSRASNVPGIAITSDCFISMGARVMDAILL